MGRRELIVEELLEAMDKGGDVDFVLRRHGDSRNILYQALVIVIRIAEDRLRKAVRDVASARKLVETLQQQAEAMKAKNEELQERVASLEHKEAEVAATLKTKQTLLNESASLERIGFDAERLRQLRAVLERMAVERKLPLDKVTEVFFELLDRLDDPVALKIEEQRAEESLHEAKAAVERGKADARHLDEVAEARRGPIEALERLRGRGVKENDIPDWSRLLSASRTSPKRLTQKIGQFGTLQKAVVDLKRQRDELAAEQRDRVSKVESLKEEWESVGAQLMEMRQEMLVLSMRRERIEGEAEELGDLIQFARAVTFKEAEEIRKVPPTTIFLLLTWIVYWSEETGHRNVSVPPGSTYQVPWLSFLGSPVLHDLLRMAAATLGAAILPVGGRRV